VPAPPALPPPEFGPEAPIVLKFLASLAGLSVLLLARPVLALPTEFPYAVSVGGGRAGTLRFFFDQEITGACRYLALWDPGAGVPDEQCGVDEMITVGNDDCDQNATRPLISMLVASVGVECRGFDSNRDDNSIFWLMLIEMDDGSLEGLIQFDSSDAPVVGVTAAPER
jgi:hypothetical protein